MIFGSNMSNERDFIQEVRAVRGRMAADRPFFKYPTEFTEALLGDRWDLQKEIDRLIIQRDDARAETHFFIGENDRLHDVIIVVAEKLSGIANALLDAGDVLLATIPDAGHAE